MHIDVLEINEHTLRHVFEREISDGARLVSRISEPASASRRYACEVRRDEARRRDATRRRFNADPYTRQVHADNLGPGAFFFSEYASDLPLYPRRRAI